MGEPAEKTIRRLFALSGNRCAFPGCSLPLVESAGTVTGEICHIKARSKDGPRYDGSQTDGERHAFENLILLCRRHHKVVDSEPDLYSAEALQEIKSIHEGVEGRPEQATDGFFAKILLNDLRRVSVVNNSGNVAINSPGAIQAQTVNVKSTRRSVTVNAPPGTIGADQQASRYVQHLIKRYNEFASADKTRRTKFSFGALSSNIESRFGGPWKLLPAERFQAVCEYLQQRIAKTILAKQNHAKGVRSFSSYAEFRHKHDRQDE
ncbi:MAG TPA: HNH endonuclease signature motif containing protein [Accumulibacter sp.]|nr:HNH endonuclease signature motif containing protein [Accumulibacter sp.]